MANFYKRYHSTLLASSPTTLLTVPEASTAIVRSIWFCNPGGSSATVKVSVSPLGSGTHYLVFNQALDAGAFFDIVGTKPTGPLVLEGLDQLKVESSLAGVTVFVSALLVDRT